MAVIEAYSDQETNSRATPAVKNGVLDSGKIRVEHFTFTAGAAAGDAGSTVELCRLKPGQSRILGHLSNVAFSAFGASRVLDIGHRGYTDNTGTAVAADADAFANDIDVSSAGTALLTSGAATADDDTFRISSRDEVVLYATVAGGTIPAAATIKGTIVYMHD